MLPASYALLEKLEQVSLCHEHRSRCRSSRGDDADHSGGSSEAWPSCATLDRVVIAVIVLAALLCLALGAAAYLNTQLTQARHEIEELRQALESSTGAAARAPRTTQAVQTAGLAMKTALDTVTRMRDQGVRSTLLTSLDDFTRWALE